MSIQEKFEKAVNVIRNLPKNGSYQPSHELQLRFYAFYKQATEGANPQVRPSFWEVVKRAKWDAWTKLGNMTKEEAMCHYIDELRKIVETMSYTENVANFVNSLDDFYDHVPAEDLEMLVGPIIEKIRSRPNSPLSGSPLASRDTSPDRGSPPFSYLHPHSRQNGTAKHITASLETSPASSYSASPRPPDTDDDEEEHFLDTQTEPDKGKEGLAKKRNDDPPASRNVTKPLSSEQPTLGPGTRGTMLDSDRTTQNFVADSELVKVRLSRLENKPSDQGKSGINYENCNGVNQHNNATQGYVGPSEVTSEAFKKAVANLSEEMEALQRRMTLLESIRSQEVIYNGGKVSLWDLSLSTSTALFMWPVVVLVVFHWMNNRRSK